MLADLDQLKIDLAATEKAQDSSYAITTQAQSKANAIEVALARIQTVVCDPIYERVFNKGISRVGTTTAGWLSMSALKLS